MTDSKLKSVDIIWKEEKIKRDKYENELKWHCFRLTCVWYRKTFSILGPWSIRQNAECSRANTLYGSFYYFAQLPSRYQVDGKWLSLGS